MSSSCNRRDSGWMLGLIYSQKGSEVLEWAAHEGSAITVTGTDQETCRCVLKSTDSGHDSGGLD